MFYHAPGFVVLSGLARSVGATLVCGVLALGFAPVASAQESGAKLSGAPQAKASTPTPSADNGAPALSASEFATRVQAFYQQTRDFHAGFVQTYTDVAAGDTKRSQGTVYFKKPGKMRWDYVDPSNAKKRQKVLVSDGSNFWVYEPQFQQVFKECLRDSQLPSSLRFLMGDGNLIEEFDVVLAPKFKAEAPEIRLTPKKATSLYKELRFLLDPKTFQVRRTTILDPYGNTNQIEFSRIEVNRNLPDSGFDFTPPKGVRFLNPQKTCK